MIWKRKKEVNYAWGERLLDCSLLRSFDLFHQLAALDADVWLRLLTFGL